MSNITYVCKIDSCGRSHLARGMCAKHYRRWKKWGDPHKCLPPDWNRQERARSREPLYQLYLGMMRRCNQPQVYGYKYYGGRGIRVCERWADEKNGIWNFIEDMGQRPSPAHSLDRIDVDGHYEPTNCRWATTVEQGNNRRNSKNRLTKPHPVV